MSCNYAEGLSPYENKGVLGLPEVYNLVFPFIQTFESPQQLDKKCELLYQMMAASQHVVVHTGAGISTSAGIPDFRGPNGVWTLERDGKKPSSNVSFADARPTRTHMILRRLVECGRVQYVVSQNIDGLHLRSGLPRARLAELHGNMFIDECNVCNRQFVRSEPVETVGKRTSNRPCVAGRVSGRPCRGRLHDGVLDWEHSLPESDLLMAEWHSSIADLSICLGTTLQIVPSGNLPLETLKYGGKLVACNLQPTKHDNKLDLKINYYVDDILERVIKHFKLEVPDYDMNDDPTFLTKCTIIEWSIARSIVREVGKLYKSKCKGVKKKRLLVKRKRHDDFDENATIKKEVISCLDDDVKNEVNSMGTAHTIKVESGMDLTEDQTNGVAKKNGYTAEDTIKEVPNLVKESQSKEDSKETSDSLKDESQIVIENNSTSK